MTLPPGLTPEMYQELKRLSPEERSFIRYQAEQARSLRRKQQAEDGLLSYIRWIFQEVHRSPFYVNFHHEMMSEYLEAVANGQIKNLIINIPPRYGKTEEAVIGFNSWCFARNPTCNFIHTSYAEKLVMDNSSKIREVVSHESFQAYWPLEFREDTNAKGLWRNSVGGGFLAVPAGGSITGFGAGSTELGCFGKKFAGAIGIDDPLKPDDAGSEIERGKVNARLNNTLISRRNSRETPFIISMQRLHEMDMTGYILAGNTPLEWEHLRLPALRKDEKGTMFALWPMKHTVEELLLMKKADPYVFAGQYMQEPAPEDGEYFKKNMFPRYQTLPNDLVYYGASDYATRDGTGDYTVHGVAGLDADDNIYIVDWWRERTTSDVWVEIVIDMMQAWEPAAWGEEAGQIRNVMEPILKKRMQERNTYCYRVQFPTSVRKGRFNDAKMEKCRSIQARMFSGKVFFPETAPWVDDLIAECIKFPNGANDDQCDVLGSLGRMISGMRGREAEQPVTIPKVKTIQETTLDEMYGDDLVGG